MTELKRRIFLFIFFNNDGVLAVHHTYQRYAKPYAKVHTSLHFVYQKGFVDLIKIGGISMLNNIFNDELINGEEILWSGQPDKNVIFSKIDIFFIPFSIMWGGFAIFWEVSVSISNAPFFFKLWGIPFVLVGLYMIFGRFFYKAYLKAKTYYAVTNKRVIIVLNNKNKFVKSEYIDRLTGINKNQNSMGKGSIRFGNTPFGYGMYENMGMDFFARSSGYSSISFFDIEDVENVYRMVNDIRKTQ